MPLPNNMFHVWNFDLELSNASATGKKCYRCQHCSQWTDDPDANHSACPSRERRKTQRRKYHNRRMSDQLATRALTMAAALQTITRERQELDAPVAP